ncbi:MAG: EAL domain-containing protein [Gammaproteobacteria bacterium]|nr:EAL domain-containing protein [Gammaproteobacteria bacterium]
MGWNGNPGRDDIAPLFGSLAVKAYGALVVAVVLASAAFYILIVGHVHHNTFALEERYSRSLAEQIYLEIEGDADWVEEFAEASRRQHLRHLEDIITMAHTMAATQHAAVQTGGLTDEAARAQALEQIGALRFGDGNYVWVIERTGLTLSHPDPAIEGRNILDLRDPDGRLVIRPILKQLETADEATHRYRFPRADLGEASDKLSFARDFAPWGWVIGGGIYLDDVSAAVTTAKAKLAERLRARLRQAELGGDGFVFIFDGDRRLLVHPDPAREGASLDVLINPSTGRSLASDIMDTLAGGHDTLEYDANGSKVPGQEMVAWLRHAPSLDWYVVAALDKAALARHADAIALEITAIAGGILLVMLAAGAALIRHGLNPLKELAAGAERVSRGDYGFRLDIRRRDEIGTLAAAFNRMLEHIHGDIRGFEQNAAQLRRARKVAEASSLAKERLLEEVRQSQSRLSHLANHDALTGLPNRKLFYEVLERAVAQAGERDGALAVLFVDLDRFKNINDSLGHAVGDDLLQAVAGRLRHNLRQNDVLARLGGDEFVILMDPIREDATPATLGQGLLAALGQPFMVQEDHELYVDASIGISIFPRDGRSAVQLVKNADAAMYQAKETGGARVAFYAAELTDAVAERLTLETRLRQALAGEHLRLAYQPVYALETGEVVGFEALARWHDDDLGEVPPARFIPLAEDTGLINRIGEWAIDTACRQLQAWRRTGLGRQRVAINVSPRQLQQPALADLVSASLTRYELLPHQLEMEITETALMVDDLQSRANLEQLHDLGVAIAVDDFGTGYSSLAYLRKLAVTRLKVDRSFVADIPGDPSDMEIVSAIIGLAHQLHIEVTAEGVETAEQEAFLRQQRCDQLQGYRFSLPLEAAQVAQLLRGVAPRAAAS